MLLALIVACEIGFWVLLGLGLAFRYLLRRRRIGAAFLIATPVVDLALFVATVIDLRRGAEASFVHGLAAAYIGFSIAFGHSLIRWADQRVAYRFAGGPPPAAPPPRGTRQRVDYEWRGWLLGLLGWAVACALLGGGILLVGDWDRSGQLVSWVGRLTFALAVWLVGWPVWEEVRLRTGSPPDRTEAGGEPSGSGRDAAPTAAQAQAAQAPAAQAPAAQAPAAREPTPRSRTS